MWDGHYQDQDEDKIEMELQQLSRESLANLMTTHKVLAQTDTEGWKYLVVHIFALVMWSSKNCSRVLIYMCREIWKMSANKMQHFNEQLLLL